MKTSTLVLLFGCFSVVVLSSSAGIINNEKSTASNEVSFQYCSEKIDTNSHANCLASIFRFTANVGELDAGYCVESSEITLNNLLWKVKLCKREISVTNTTNVADIFLQSSSNESNTAWACEAKATIKVFPNRDHDRILVRKLAKRKYTNSKSTDGINELLSWDDLMEQYAEKNEINFEIEISTNGVHNSSPSNVNQTFSRLQIFLEKVSELEVFKSSEVIAQGIKWRVHIRKRNNELGVYLEADESNFRMGSSYNVTATFKLLSFDINKMPLTKYFTHNYRWGSFANGFDSYLSWNDFIDIDNKYVVKDRANLLVQFNVEDPKSLWDVEGNDISKSKNTLECSGCHEQFGSGEISTHTSCGHLLCKSCSSYANCKHCKFTLKPQELYAIHFGDN